MSETPQHGDKVRVSYEGTWYQTPRNTIGLVKLEDGRFKGLPSGTTVEILEHADDPANDPIGTLRKETIDEGYSLWGKLPRFTYPPKAGTTWRLIETTMSQSTDFVMIRSDALVQSFPVVGSIPGTSADKLMSPKVTVEHSDPEPDRELVYTDDNGLVWSFSVGHGVGWSSDFTGRMPWSEVIEYYEHTFPWTRAKEVE